VLLSAPQGPLEYLVAGRGDPVTVFAHGLGGAISHTRPLASGVPGTRAFFHFRGHGNSFRPADFPGYAGLAADLAAVADHVGAIRALGVSMGAAALLSLVAERPRRFDRLVFVLPAVIDEMRSDSVRRRLGEMSAAIANGTVAEFVRTEIPESVRDPGDYVAARAAALGRLDDFVRATADAIAVPDRSVLTKVEAPTLVIGALGDPLHDVAVARDLAGLLPDARLHVFPDPGFVWTRRAELRDVIGGFLS
jgi:pimeloyl-ACP methyl ester carboxylesterase